MNHPFLILWSLSCLLGGECKATPHSGAWGWGFSANLQEHVAQHEEVFIHFVDSFGHSLLKEDGLHGHFRKKEAQISEKWSDTENGFLVRFLKPSKSDSWRATIHFSLTAGGLDLTAKVDLGSLNAASGEPVIVELLPEEKILFSGYVLDEKGNLIPHAQVIYFKDGDPEHVLERTHTLRSGGFWFEKWEWEDLPVVLSITRDGYERVDKFVEKGDEILVIVMKKGTPVSGQVILPDGIMDATLKFRSGIEVQTAKVGPSGAFEVFGVGPGDWDVFLERNSISISLGSHTSVPGKDLLFDARPYSKAIRFDVLSSEKEEGLTGAFAFKTNEGEYQEIPLDSFGPVLIPSTISEGTILSPGFLDQIVVFDSSYKKVLLDPGIACMVHVIAPPEFADLDVFRVSAKSVQSVRGKQIQLDLYVDFYARQFSSEAVFCHLGEFKFYATVMGLGIPGEFTYPRLIDIHTESGCFLVERGLQSDFNLTFTPEWLAKVKPFLKPSK